MNIRPADAATLARLFIAEHARTPDPTAAMTAALAQLAAEHRASTDRYVAETIARVEAVCDIDLRSTQRRSKTDLTRGLAYWLIHRQDVTASALAAAIRRDHSSVWKTLETFRKRLAASADWRARLAWAAGQFERRERAAG